MDPTWYKHWKQPAKARLLWSNLQAANKEPLPFTYLEGLAQAMIEGIHVDSDIPRQGCDHMILPAPGPEE